MQTKKLIFFLLKFIFSIIFFYLIFKKVNLDLLFKSLIDVKISLLLLGYFLIFLQIIGISYRLFLIIKNNKLKISFQETIKITLEGAFLNQALPLSIGGDAIKIWRIQQHNDSFFYSFLIVLIDRLLGLFALIILSIFSINFFYSHISFSSFSFNYLVLVFFIICLIYLGYKQKKRLQKIIEPIFFIKKNINFYLFFISLFTHSITFLGIYFLCLSLGINITYFTIISLMPIVFLATMIPLSIGGWGIREISMIYILGFNNVSNELSFGLSLIFGLGLIVTSLPGGLFLLIRKLK